MLKQAYGVGSVTILFGLLVVISGCVGSNVFVQPPPPPTPEAYCASHFNPTGFGHFFYCGTNQATTGSRSGRVTKPLWHACRF